MKRNIEGLVMEFHSVNASTTARHDKALFFYGISDKNIRNTRGSVIFLMWSVASSAI